MPRHAGAVLRLMRLPLRAVEAVGFAVALVIFGLPFLLFDLLVHALQDRVERRWPGSERARSVSFWLRLLAPVAVILVLLVAIGVAVPRVREAAERHHPLTHPGTPP